MPESLLLGQHRFVDLLVLPKDPASVSLGCVPRLRLSGPSCAPAAAMETRQRRPEELGLLQALSAGSGPDSPRAAPTPPGPELSRETAWSIGSQVTLPFLFAGLGLSGAGILLHYFQVGGDTWGCWGWGAVQCPPGEEVLHAVRCGQGRAFCSRPLLLYDLGKSVSVTDDRDWL